MAPGGLGRAALTVDAALAVLLSAGGVLSGLARGDFPHPGPTVAALMGLAGLLQALRRVRPLTSFTGSFALMGAVALLYGHFESGASLLIAVVGTFSAVV
jgi:hypothetical protein